MASAPWYRVGTASVTAGSKIVTGVDTLWLGVLGVGDLFTVDGTRWAEVESVTNNGALVLKTPWGGATAANQAYAVARNFTGTTMADLAASLGLLKDRYHATLDEMSDLYTAAGDVQVTDPEGVKHTVPSWVKLAAQIGAALPKAGGTVTGALTVEGAMQVGGGLVVPKAYSDTSSANFVATGNIPGISFQSGYGARMSALTSYVTSDSTSFLVGTGNVNPNTEALRINHADGSLYAPRNVGINVAYPAVPLDIAGVGNVVRISTATENATPLLYTSNSNVQGGAVQCYVSHDGAHTRLGSARGDLIFDAGSINAERMRISAGGGVATPYPLKPGQYTLGTLPAASAYNGHAITVSNATQGVALCISNGTSWVNVTTNTYVS